MSYHIKIDTRERALIAYFEREGYAFEVVPLDVGDLQITDGATGTPFIILERKTYADLAASIKDGRYKEQKERMLKAYPKRVRKIMVLEGNKSSFPMSDSVLNGVIVNSMIRDHIMVYAVRNIAEWEAFMHTILVNLMKYHAEVMSDALGQSAGAGGAGAGAGASDNAIPTFSSDLAAYQHSVKAGKKENLTPRICFRNMLCQISGVSNLVADALVERFHSMNDMMATLHEEGESDAEKMSAIVSEIRFGKNNRKIGKLGGVIVRTLLGTTVPDAS